MEKKDNRTVHFYLTPLAIILVLLAIIFGNPVGRDLYISLGLLVLSVVMNIFGELVDNIKFNKIRIWMNIIINSMLLFFIGKYWAPIWLLFVLTPVAVATKKSRGYTFITSLVISTLLVFIYILRGATYFVNWGVIASQVVFIIFISLFINHLSMEKNC